MNETRVCQFCGQLDYGLIYYAMRHYAHGKCIIERLPTDRILALKDHPLGQLPVLALEEHGLLELVSNELARRGKPRSGRARAVDTERQTTHWTEEGIPYRTLDVRGR